MKKVIYSAQELKKKYKKIAKALYDRNRSMMDRLKDI